MIGLLAVLTAGCGPKRLLPVRKPDAPPAASRSLPPPAVPPEPEIVAAKAEESADKPPRRPKTILAMSGGGSYGAFTAGVLNGWTKSNRRPEFDVVTGVSTGALIAPLAFLGPKYDDDLKEAYTEIRRRDVMPLRNVVTIPFKDSVASSAGLRKLVEDRLTEGMIQDIVAEHRKGRRLYVATTNLDTRKNVVWDLGAIAERDGKSARRLIVEILVASAAIPGVFPPVAIDIEVNGRKTTERHVDGGVTTPVFVPTSVFEHADTDAKLYVVVAGKYYAEEKEVRPRLLKVVTASGGAMMSAQTRRSVANLYHLSKAHNVQFHAIALRQDFAIEESKIDFEPAAMTKLFNEGVHLGVSGPKWETQPPDLGPGDDAEIRTGSRLK